MVQDRLNMCFIIINKVIQSSVNVVISIKVLSLIALYKDYGCISPLIKFLSEHIIIYISILKKIKSRFAWK